MRQQRAAKAAPSMLPNCGLLHHVRHSVSLSVSYVEPSASILSQLVRLPQASHLSHLQFNCKLATKSCGWTAACHTQRLPLQEAKLSFASTYCLRWVLVPHHVAHNQSLERPFKGLISARYLASVNTGDNAPALCPWAGSATGGRWKASHASQRQGSDSVSLSVNSHRGVPISLNLKCVLFLCGKISSGFESASGRDLAEAAS